MGRMIDTPFIAHSELTDEIYIIDKKAKYCVTDQVIKAVVATNRAIPKADYEARLEADMVAMLTDMLIDVEEIASREQWCDYANDNCISRYDVEDLFQQKINALKADTEAQDGQTSN